MISRQIPCEPGYDNYRRLAHYIAGASHEGEKSLMSWCAGCWAGEGEDPDNYELAVQEVVDTQDLNTRTTKEKTYHLVISFRPEDEVRLTPEKLKEIEKEFAAALGFEGHQRHCGVHKNTNNLHMHIAYNMIHPEKLTRHDPIRDYIARDRACRALERKYGLYIDNGRASKEHDQQRAKLTPGAASLEAHTGQQSFESYAQDQRQAILSSMAEGKITRWQDLHETLVTYGMEIKPHANGLIVKDRHSKQAMKASSLDRSLSMKKLEALLGPFVPARNMEAVKEQSRYEAAPLHRSPERGTLFVEYQAGIEKRKASLAAIKEQEENALDPIRKKWAAKREEIARMHLPQRSKFKLAKLARAHEAEALAKARQLLQVKKDAVKTEVPYSSWADFLRRKADQGDELALAILRSTKEEVSPEQDPAADVSRATLLNVRVEYLRKTREVLESDELQAKSKNGLLSVLKMERLAAEDAAQGSFGILAGVTPRIDKRGNVLFTLASGGLVRDTGKGVFFTAHDKAAQEAAMRYAKAKWGKRVKLEGNQLQFAPELQREKQRGMER